MISSKRPALFLDRDGVINVDYGYVCKQEQFDFIEGIFELVAAANRQGYMVVVVTNQAGIGRGYYTEFDFHKLSDWMRRQFEKQGACIDAVYFCPYHPVEGIGKYRQQSNMRKPEPGMLIQAAFELNIDLKNSIIIGDKETDMQAGFAAGVQHLLKLNKKSKIGIMIKDLQEAIPYLHSDNSKILNKMAK